VSIDPTKARVVEGFEEFCTELEISVLSPPACVEGVRTTLPPMRRGLKFGRG
jgi:hypothetical protein